MFISLFLSLPLSSHAGYQEAQSQHIVKKFLQLVLLLDKAKLTHLIDHDPCLFERQGSIKVRNRTAVLLPLSPSLNFLNFLFFLFITLFILLLSLSPNPSLSLSLSLSLSQPLSLSLSLSPNPSLYSPLLVSLSLAATCSSPSPAPSYLVRET